MCRNITPLRGLAPPATAEEIEAAALQYVRKVGAISSPSSVTREAIEQAVQKIAAATTELLAELPLASSRRPSHHPSAAGRSPPSSVRCVDPTTPSVDERAAMRAFLQRCEVRLSTMHRAATALLSGAGILVLLPALERDSVVQVMRVLLVGPISASRALEALAIALSIALALLVLWLVIMELTRFYFHANHVEHEHGEVFTPRFTLTGLRLATDELSPEADADYQSVHGSIRDVRLLVPANDRARAKIDRQLGAYPGLVERQTGDADGARAEALFELAASRRRTMIEDVSKIEYGMVRHMLRLQVIILRYVKALLVILVTSLAAFVCAAAITPGAPISAGSERWIAGTMALWAPIAIIVVGSPVRWLERLLRTEGATHTAVRNDAELTQVERITTWFGIATWAVASAASVTLLVHHSITDQGRVATIGALVVSTGLLLFALVRPHLASD